MKNTIFYGITAFSLLLCSAGYATNYPSINSGFYILGEAGASFSNNENFGVPPNSIDWSRPQDDLSSRIGTSPLLGAGIGYTINPLLSTDLTYTQRWNFNYDRDFIAADRARSFDLNDQALLASIYLHADGIPNLNWGWFHPYIGAGIGAAWNHTSNFASTYISTREDAARFTTSFYKNDSGLAWQLTAGTRFILSAKCSLDLGYRYLNMGDAKTGIEYETIDNGQRARDPLTANNISAQEVYVNLNYHFKAL